MVRGVMRRRGASTTGCLVSLVILLALLYYGVNIGELYLRYYRLLDAMDTQARVAAALDNGTIHRRIQDAIDDIGLPQAAHDNLTITRTASPREITIETQYSESVHLPLFDHTFRFHPKANESL